MGHNRIPCPFDNSRLVEMGLSYGEKGLDLSIWYCPRCDIAFVFLSPARSAISPSVLQWHRQNGQLELREQDRPQWEELPRQFREAWESNVRHHVKLFLGGRNSEWVSCQLDGTRTPVLHRWQDSARTDWLFSWCRWCKLGFLFASSADYGWECCASVVWDLDRRKYQLDKEYETGVGHVVDQPLLDKLPPFSPES
jgi:hypothetical protein